MLIQPISSFSFHAQHIERDNADKNASSLEKMPYGLVHIV